LFVSAIANEVKQSVSLFAVSPDNSDFKNACVSQENKNISTPLNKLLCFAYSKYRRYSDLLIVDE
jgi:hypothetical protein